MTVTLNLSPEIARRLQDKAAQSGQTLQAYLERLAEHDAGGSKGPAALPPDLADEEWDRLLDELAAGPTLPHLPPDFSRADVYADHD
jgi:hypothetical protein